MKLILVIYLAFVIRTSKALVKCDGGMTKLKLCSLVEKYDKGVPLECKHCDPLEMRSSVTVFKVEGHFNPGFFNPKLQPQTFELQTFQP